MYATIAARLGSRLRRTKDGTRTKDIKIKNDSIIIGIKKH
jgi:hypothetical protein